MLIRFQGLAPLKITLVLCFFITLLGLLLPPKIEGQTFNANTQASSSIMPENPFAEKEAKVLDIRPTDVIHWRALHAHTSALELEVGLTLTTDRGFTLYADQLRFNGPFASVVKELSAPTPFEINDPTTASLVKVYGAGDFMVRFSLAEPLTKDFVEISVRYLGCTKTICLFPYTQNIRVPLLKEPLQASSPPAPFPAQSSAPLEAFPSHVEAPSVTLSTPAPQASWGVKSTDLWSSEGLSKSLEQGELSLWLILGVLFLGGLFTNLTPCVFPMIPITLRILSVQKQKSAPYLYALGIMITYTSLGAVAGFTGAVFGGFAGGFWFNVFFALVLFYFGLSMLGIEHRYFNFQALQNLGAKIGSGRQGAFNCLLMGLGAGFVAAPCTGPILGGLLAFTAKNKDVWQSVGLFASYSFGFALPYVFLGAFASKALRLQVSSYVQLLTKVLFAAAMFALSFYYLRIPFRPLAQLTQTNYYIAAACFFLIALVGLWFFLKQPKKALWPALTLGVALFSLVMAFIAEPQGHKKIHWLESVEEGMAKAKELNRPIFIDGFAEWCAACKEMDRTTYINSDVVSELSEHWVPVKLDFTQMDDEDEKLALRYEMQGLPVSILLPYDANMEHKRRLTGYLASDVLLKELKSFRTK